MTSKKIIFFVSNLNSGGLENYLLRFLQEYSNHFSRIVIFCKSGKGGDLEKEYLEIQNIEIIKREVGNFHIHHYVYLYNWLKNYKDFAICDFSGNFAGPVIFIGKILNISKRITSYRNSSNRFQESFLKLIINKFYNRLVFKNSTDIVFNSKEAISFFFNNQNIDKRFKVIFNGINVPNFTKDSKSNLRKEFNIPKDAFVIGHTGRYNAAKNHKTIIRVAEELINSDKNIFFILCGKGVKINLSNEIEGSNISKNIILNENRRDISEFLNSCDAYIFPSISEGQPNSLIEAWVKGLPFVASNINTIKDILPVEYHSQLFSPMDVNGYVNGLKKICQIFPGNLKDKKLAQWASFQFDAKVRFKEFYNILN